MLASAASRAKLPSAPEGALLALAKKDNYKEAGV